MSERQADEHRTPSLAPTVAAVLVLAISEAGAVWYFGFGSVIPQLWFGSLTALLVWSSVRLARGWFASGDFVDGAVRSACVAFAIVVLLGFVLGASHHLTLPAYLAAEAVVSVAAFLLARPRPAAPIRDTGIPLLLVAVWVAIVAFVIGTALSRSPYTAYDAVSYHLFFPARWLGAHQLSIVPTPFSDEAQAYQPSNGELWMLWLMLPFHGDILARMAQVPFYVLGAAVSYLLARRAGASARAAAFAPTFFLLAPPLVQQASGADVDLIAASMLITTLYLGLVASETDATREWLLWGAAVGLFLGTKYLALVYLPVAVLVPQLRGLRRRALWGLPGMMALGLPWYVRNWAVAGSPIYPASLAVAGVTVGRGAYSHAAMLQSFMHSTSPRILAVALVHAFGTAYFTVAAPLAVAAIATTILRRRWWPALAIAGAAGGVVALCWLSVGDNTDARFLLPAVALLPALVPLLYGEQERRRIVIDSILGAAMVWIVVGLEHQSTLGQPWFMDDWLSWQGLVSHDYLVLFAAIVLVSGCFAMLASQRRAVAAAAVALACAAGVTLGIEAESWCLPGRCTYLPIDPPHFRLAYLYGARWLGDHVHGANVAYTGVNLPYPLAGSHLSNTVSYVNIDSHWPWRFDDYARAFERGELSVPAADSLAEPSGVLMPAGRPQDAIRPRFERRIGDPEAWKMNLRREQIGFLFVAALDGYEVDYVRHNPRKFPIEDDWARADPRGFQLVYENDEVRIYAVTLPIISRAR